MELATWRSGGAEPIDLAMRKSASGTRIFVAAAVLTLSGGCAASKAHPVPQPFPQPDHLRPATTPPEISTPTAPPASAPSALPSSPTGESAEFVRSRQIVESAKTQLGVKYVMGGDRPATGFDCSGLVAYVFAAFHVDLPRTVGEQFRRGVPIATQDARPGDLVFFTTTGPGPTHVGIITGPGEFIHAPSSNGVVRLEHYDSAYWHQRLIGTRRVIGN